MGSLPSAIGLSITFQSGRCLTRSEPTMPRSGMKGMPFSDAWSAAWIAGQVASLIRIVPALTAAVKRGAGPSSPIVIAAVSISTAQPAPISTSACRPLCGTETSRRLRAPRRTSARVAAIGGAA